MKVTVYSTKKFEIEYLEKANKDKHQLQFIEESLSSETTKYAIGHDAVCIFVNDDASKKVLEKLHAMNIHHIAVRAAGYDQVDLKTSGELNFNVANVPEYSPYSIAEHAVTMMLSMNRKIVLADNHVKANNFSLDELIGFDLNGKTVGIIGVGKIGGITAKILHGFGCKILGFDIEQKKEFTEKYGLQYTTLERLFKESDIITLHSPLNQQTKYIINKNTLSLMKKGVMIVNTGRGGLINTLDAIDALKEGKIGYLGLDVYEKEKGLFFFDHSKDTLHDEVFAQLLEFKNVLITGHQAFLTENALKNIADTTIYNLDCWQQNKESKNELVKK